MINTSKTLRNLGLGAAAIAVMLLAGIASSASAQRDPFAKASWAKPKPAAPTGVAAAAKTGGKTTKAAVPAVPANYGPPTIEARIEYYKRMREQAAAAGQPLPKVTSVLTLGEMAVTGIFKTPRGYAAMVEATPIKLSYTIYPGEKFFDGQLVAVEENRLVFRRVTKTGPNKYVASVENKPLQQYTVKAQIEGTAPKDPADKPQTAAATPVTKASTSMTPLVDEMINPPTEPQRGRTNKPVKKPVKVAKTTPE